MEFRSLLSEKFYFHSLDPPGHAMLKQLEVECAKNRCKEPDLPLQTFKIRHKSSPSLSIITQSLHQPTPVTPPISSLHRDHPVAGFNSQPNLYLPSNKLNTAPIQGAYNRRDTPPLPPLPIHELQHQHNVDGTPPPPPPPLAEFEDLSPTVIEFDKKHRHKNGKKLPPLEILKQRVRSRSNSGSPVNITKGLAIRYSPVSNSDRSISPVSPAVKDITPVENILTVGKFSKYEAISDSEQAGLEVEDISPELTPKNDNKLEKQLSVEDDAMSLSSISSTEGSNVELNVRQLKKDTLHTLHTLPEVSHIPANNSLSSSNIRNPIYPQYTPNIPPPQRFFPPLQQNMPVRPGGILPNIQPPQTVGLMDFALSMHQRFNQLQYQQPMFQHNKTVPVLRPDLATSSNRVMNGGSNFNNGTATNNSNHRPKLQQSFSQNLTHAEIIKNALYGCTNLPVPINPSQIGAYTPQRPYQQPPSVVTPQLPQTPVVPKVLPFSFQVKAGCARDLSQELKRILAKDTLKRLVEQSAFSAFENWWEKQKTPKSLSESENTKPIKTDDVLTKNTLADKSSNIIPQSGPQATKQDISTTSVLLQNLFGHDKNNENTPPFSANFLNSFRISRKPHTQSAMKVNHISRKRPLWPSLNKKNKLQRLEDSEEEDEDMDEDDDDGKEEDQFEQFALRQSEC